MSTEQDSIHHTTSQVRLDREESNNWELMTSRRTKGQTGGHIKTKRKDLKPPINQIKTQQIAMHHERHTEKLIDMILKPI
jgi:hypothetical protein